VDAFLAVASKREVRGYSDRPVPDAAVRRILEAGRIAGSSRNRQPWRFLVVGDPGVRERVVEAVFAPGNVRARRWWWRSRCGEADRWLSTLVAPRRT
jgi:nitroreductase